MRRRQGRSGRLASATLVAAAALLLARAAEASVGCAVVLLGEARGGGRPAADAETALVDTVKAAEVGVCAARPPRILNLTLTPNPRNHLSATLAFETSRGATATVVVSGPEGDFTVPAGGRLTPARTRSHRFAVLGLVPGAAYTVTATARGPFGLVSEPKSASYTPGPMPEDFPAFEVAVSKPEKMQPGVTMFNLGRATGDVLSDIAWSWLLMTDDAGRVVWYHRARPGVSALRRLASGNLAYLSFDPFTLDAALEEITPLGETVALWTASQLGLDSMHHHIEELPNGNLVVLANEMRAVGGYPESFPDCPEGVCNVVGDRIVEFTRDGEVARAWSLFDVLDPHRTGGADFHLRLWDALYGGQVTKDWTHSNAVIYDPNDDSFLVSSRNQDLVFKMSRETGAFLWVLGLPDPASTADDAWPYLVPDLSGPGWAPSRQHAPELLSGGRLRLYDNGNARKFTSVVEYGINEADRTARFNWHWEDPDFSPKLYAPWVGDVDTLPNGNLLVADGALLLDRDNEKGRVWSKITEVVQETGEKVFDLRIRDNSPENPTGYELYRAERLSLYPPAESETPSP